MNICEVRNNKFYCNESCSYIDTPAVLIDVVNDTLLKFGEYDALQQYFDATMTAYSAIGINIDIKLVNISTLNPDEQCYVVNRMLNYTLSGFVKEFAAKLGAKDSFDWLHNEMQRVVIQ